MLMLLRRLINGYFDTKVKDIYYKDGAEIADYLEGEKFIIVILADTGIRKQINITNRSNIQIVRDILFELS